ncbi:methyl-accepting chemotaxis protein [Phormidium sp. CCY1219]|uniref:methyl-accepting chemotaxis protein n=1 Tax=Phormidium sp. CCY1219 TaxID=2886104 RepID=UPI002D1E5D79|nr:methyl-accepting chemotaxis protein [Phormidium sp. CCY1219]MEB3827081.1 methyl-accepting chemotaxis protein [Phormidium sp. CCY1219]
MFKGLKLRSRILLGYSIPLLFSIVAASVVYGTVKQVKQQVFTAEIGKQLVRSSDRIAWSIAAIHRGGRGYLLDPEPAILKNIDEAIATYNDSMLYLQEHVKNEEQKRRLNEIVRLAEDSIEFNRSFVNLVRQNQREKALEIYSSAERQRVTSNIEEKLAEFNAVEGQLLDEKNDRVENMLEFLTQVVLLSTATSVVVALILGWAIATRITETINDTAATIASSSTEIAATSEQQERMANQQASAVHQTTTTMDELAASSEQSADTAESTREQVEQIATQIQHLTEQVNQINKIANLVSEIANQTNMLALNAAVEAVRAGEHGKGFGVVASEIRKLADRSKQSAEKITGLVVDIQNATNSAVVVMKDGTRSVESIVAVINNISVNAQQISLSAKQQAVAIQQVVEAMNNLNQSAQENASGIAQTKIGIQQLNQAAIRLKEEV